MTVAAIPPPIVIEDRLGSVGMKLFIVTEASLFVFLFFSYFYLAHGQTVWPTDMPKLTLSLPMLVVLVASSFILARGERGAKSADFARARVATIVTILFGVAFLVMQFFEYADRLKTLRPTSNAYGSIFYTITTLHGAHVFLGLTMLVYVLLLPRLGPGGRSPHRPLHNAAMYWHFVDVVWVFIVALLYVLPHLRA